MEFLRLRPCATCPMVFRNRLVFYLLLLLTGDHMKTNMKKYTKWREIFIKTWRTAYERVLSRRHILRGEITFICYAMFDFLYLIVSGFITSFLIPSALLSPGKRPDILMKRRVITQMKILLSLSHDCFHECPFREGNKGVKPMLFF